MSKTAIILVSESSLPLARSIAGIVGAGQPVPSSQVTIYTKNEMPGCTAIGHYASFIKDRAKWDSLFVE